MGRNVLSHDTACPDDRLVTNGNSRQNDCIGTNPDMVPDGDRKGILKPRAALTGIDGVAGGSDAAVWRNEHMISDPDLGAVQNDQMVIGIKMLPNFNVIAIVI